MVSEVVQRVVLVQQQWIHYIDMIMIMIVMKG